MPTKHNNPIKVQSISQLHQYLQLPKPLHPMISLVDNRVMAVNTELIDSSFLFDFYKISYKYSTSGKMGYGQGYYDFTEGGMMFTAPGQLIYVDEDAEYYGYTIFFHPDFIRNYPLAKSIRKYGFFSYDTNEALHLSETEKNTIVGLLDNIDNELHTAIDEMSQDVIISYIEVLLNYSNRFYKRQFITRKAVSHDVLAKTEQILDDYSTTKKRFRQDCQLLNFWLLKSMFPRIISVTYCAT